MVIFGIEKQYCYYTFDAIYSSKYCWPSHLLVCTPGNTTLIVTDILMNDRKWNTKSHTHTHACSHDWSTFIYKLTRFILLFGVIVEVFLRIGRTLFYHHYHHTSPQKYDAKSPNGITIPFSQLLYGTWAWTSIRREKFFSLFQHHFMEVNYRIGKAIGQPFLLLQEKETKKSNRQ